MPASAPASARLPPVGEALLDACGDMVVINLPERQDRRRDFAVQLDRIGLSFAHPRVHLFDAVRPDGPGPFPSSGARGCFLSHLGVLRQALASGTDRLLLCEDDLDFAPDFERRAQAVLNGVKSLDWQMLYGFAPPEVPGQPLSEAVPVIPLPPDHGFQGAHMIALRRPVIAALVPYLEAILARPPGDPAGGPMHVDGAYNWFRREHPHLRIYATRPSIGFQRASMSDIDTKGLKDRLPGLRLLTRQGRRLLNALRRD